MRARIPILVLTCCAPLTAVSANAGWQASESASVVALRFFEAVPAVGAGAILGSLRPPHIDPGAHAQALAVLPETGELEPTSGERAKLAMVRAVLVYHERDKVFERKVIDVPQAVIALHQRAVLLISRPALRLLSGSELQALLAHEIGHDFFWQEFESTRLQRDSAGRRVLELKCDGIAVLTLLALGLEPKPLVEGVRKLTRFNERIGATANADEYPKSWEREQFVRAVRDLASVRARTGP